MDLQKALTRSLLGYYKRRKQSSSDLGIENCLRAVRATAARTKYCFLITNAGNAWPGARLVEPICDLDAFTFFIGTDPRSRKIAEITSSSKVTLAFGNSAENASLVVYGQASISTEPETKRLYWKGSWRLFFPGGPNSDDYAVIEVRAEKMEIISFRRNVIAEPFGLRPMVLQRISGAWVLQAN